MTLEGGKTDDLQIGIDLRTVVDDLQHLMIERCTLIGPQPFGIHVGEQTSKGAAHQFFQGLLLQLCQGGIGIPENSVHRMFFPIEYHLNICESNWQIVKPTVMPVIFRCCHGSIGSAKVSDHRLLLGKKLFHDLLFLPHRVTEGFTVAEIDFVGYIVYRHHRHDASAMDLNESPTEFFFQFAQRHSRFIGFTTGHMNLSDLLVHENIKHSAAIQDDLLSS